MKRKFQQGPFIITVERIEDNDPDLSYLEQDYEDCGPVEAAKYRKQNKDRLAAYRRGDWYMTAITVDVQIKTKQNWAVPHIVGRASLFGIESDSEESYFKSTEDDLINEALDDARLTYEALEAALQQAK